MIILSLKAKNYNHQLKPYAEEERLFWFLRSTVFHSQGNTYLCSGDLIFDAGQRHAFANNINLIQSFTLSPVQLTIFWQKRLLIIKFQVHSIVNFIWKRREDNQLKIHTFNQVTYNQLAECGPWISCTTSLGQSCRTWCRSEPQWVSSNLQLCRPDYI